MNDVIPVTGTWRFCQQEGSVHFASRKAAYTLPAGRQHTLCLFVNPRHACAARVTVLGLCVCLFTTLSATRNKPTKKRHQQVKHYAGLIFKIAIFVKILHSKVMTWKPTEQANMLISTGLPRLGLLALCILKEQEVTTKAVYRLPHAICPCQTLRELLAGDHE